MLFADIFIILLNIGIYRMYTSNREQLKINMERN
jgi:hypothetical protein